MARQIETSFRQIGNKWIIIITLIFSFLILSFYVIHFREASLSNSTTDWGAFGNYVGIALSTLSISLIYITYREQSLSNKSARFEQHFITMTKTLSELTEKNMNTLGSSYEAFYKHFMVPWIDFTKCSHENTKSVYVYYYSSAIGNTQNNFDFLFRYFSLCLKHIEKEATITHDEKQGRMTELVCIVPESLRVLFLCWCINNDRDYLLQYYQEGVFAQDNESEVLADVISYICTGIIPPIRDPEEIAPDSIELEDYPDEQFQDTYNRLYNTIND